MVESDSLMKMNIEAWISYLNCWLFRFSLLPHGEQMCCFSCVVRANKRPNLIVGNLRWWMRIVHVKFSLNNRYLPAKAGWTKRLRLLTHWNEWIWRGVKKPFRLAFLSLSLSLSFYFGHFTNCTKYSEKIEIMALYASCCAEKKPNAFHTNRFLFRSKSGA